MEGAETLSPHRAAAARLNRARRQPQDIAERPGTSRPFAFPPAPQKPVAEVLEKSPAIVTAALPAIKARVSTVAQSTPGARLNQLLATIACDEEVAEHGIVTLAAVAVIGALSFLIDATTTDIAVPRDALSVVAFP
jgi:hypothetical protein